MQVVPLDAPMAITARFEPLMANKLRPGLPVHVHFTALQRVDTPTITGTVTTVSADQLIDEQTHQPYFSAKVEIAAVPLDIGKDELVEAFREHGFSRLPVYKGTLDHPQGLVLLKDLALQHGFGAAGRFSLKKLLRPVLFAPPSMPAATLLQKMQRDRVHMALVIDEYGGVDGLVTIEDLIETVIGEIEDEHDEQGHDRRRQREGLDDADRFHVLDLGRRRQSRRSTPCA